MKLVYLASPVALLLALACASTGPTPELVDARRAYDQVRTSEANRLAPDRVLAAKEALDRAERAHADDAGSFDEKNQAYVARREAELAAAYADLAKAQNDRVAADQAYKQRQDQLRRSAEQDATRAQGSLDSARRDIAAQTGQLENERSARKDAEKRAADALSSLEQVAKVKEEARGTVITLSGAVLFVTAKSELLPIARDKLDSVAKALSELDSDKTVLVEGHTDSVGSDDTNMKLSQARADAVREYLISRGVKSERIKAVGRGESQPVASNDTAEGRANNRRVEIIVQNQSQSQSNSPTPTTSPNK